MTTTPCPHCRSNVPVDGERGVCPGCGRPLRFVEVPDRPCDGCGAAVPLDGQDVVRCPACGLAQAADPERPVRHQTTCVRCMRRIDIDGGASEVTCPHCGQHLRLLDAGRRG